MIREKGDGAIKASRGVKERIAANEKTYTCQCANPQHPVCK